MKLKTVKDIFEVHCWGCEQSSTDEGHDPISKTELRQEAINWLKYERDASYGKHDNDSSEAFQMVYHARTWIKHFFNITEEDLI